MDQHTRTRRLNHTHFPKTKTTVASLPSPTLANAGAAPRRALKVVDPLLLISYCDGVMKFLGFDMPQTGTTFCPTNSAFETFARASGFPKWQTLWDAAQADPNAWTPYLRRLMSYHILPNDVMPAFMVPTGLTGPYSTLLNDADTTSSGSGGGGASSASDSAQTISLQRGLTATSAFAIVNDRKQRAAVVLRDILVDGATALHGVSSVLMPPATFHTINKALRSNAQLSQTATLLAGQMSTAVNRAGTWTTVIAPDNDSWKAMTFTAPAPKWTGNITAAALRSTALLKRSVANYLVMPLQSINATVTSRKLVEASALTGSNGNMVALASSLVIDDAPQMAYVKLDAASNQLYVVGARNANAAPYMAAALLSNVTMYAGASTIIVSRGYLPLPSKTGVAKFDARLLSAWRRR
jgi:uncharacterized surface protein with fasciclin (FAS1) repeats